MALTCSSTPLLYQHSEVRSLPSIHGSSMTNRSVVKARDVGHSVCMIQPMHRQFASRASLSEQLRVQEGYLTSSTSCFLSTSCILAPQTCHRKHIHLEDRLLPVNLSDRPCCTRVLLRCNLLRSCMNFILVADFAIVFRSCLSPCWRPAVRGPSYCPVHIRSSPARHT